MTSCLCRKHPLTLLRAGWQSAKCPKHRPPLSCPSAVSHGAGGRGRPVDFGRDMAIALAPAREQPGPATPPARGSGPRAPRRRRPLTPAPRPTFRIEVHGFQGSQEGIPQAQAIGHDEVQVAGRHYALLRGERSPCDAAPAGASHRHAHPERRRPRLLPRAL